MKRIHSVITSVLLGISTILCSFILPLTVFAGSSGGFIYSVEGGEVTITGFSGSGYVTVPSQINGNPVTKIGLASLQANKTITGVNIPDSVTTIEGVAFLSCSSLKSVTIGNGVTEIGQEAFHFCKSLKSLKIGNQVKVIYDAAFLGCESLIDVVIPDSVEIIDVGVFYHCPSLKSVSLGEGVVSLGDIAFQGCTSLKQLAIGKALKTIGREVFLECNNLTDIYYTGTQEMWDSISSESEIPSGAVIHFVDKLPVFQPDFSDVSGDAFYYDAVKWAALSGITTGVGEGLFSPEKGCTRGQVVTFLWRASGSPEPRMKHSPFNDVKSDDFYYKAVLWAVENGITNGTSASKFSPEDTCTRGQIVTFLWRAAGEPEPRGKKNPFDDVKSDDFYHKAVLWAVKNGITNGTSASKFSPEDTCTRGQIVTFLWRS